MKLLHFFSPPGIGLSLAAISAITLFPAQVPSEPFVTDQKTPAEIMQDMRTELNIEPPGTNVAEQASAASKTILKSEAILRFENHQIHGVLALPARKIEILSQNGLKKIAMKSVRRIRFLREVVNEKNYPDAQESGFDSPVKCEISLKVRGEDQLPFRGLCDGTIWRKLYVRLPGQKYRGIQDHTLAKTGENQIRLTEIEFQNAKAGQLGGRS